MRWRSFDILQKVIVQADDTLWDSLPKMEEAGLQVLLVVDRRNQLVGIVTDGDVRRALLNGLDLKTQLKKVMHLHPKTLTVNSHISKAKEVMQKYNIRHVPLIDAEGRVADLIIWSDCFATVREERLEKVVIMAGGKGTRLDPFTKILPKPMIPIGDKPIIEIIMDKFYQQGFSEFILSLGYKAEIVKMYFSESNGRPYKVDFVCEEKPLGTAGALKLLVDKIKDTFIVANCDVILEINFADLLRHHHEHNNQLTIVGSVKDFTIPYGVLKTEGQNLLAIDEKPNYHFLVNTGLYVIEPQILKLIIDGELIHMTDLLQRVKEHGGKVGVYPHHGNWFDIGQWEDYRNTLRYFSAAE